MQPTRTTTTGATASSPPRTTNVTSATLIFAQRVHQEGQEGIALLKKRSAAYRVSGLAKGGLREEEAEEKGHIVGAERPVT